MVLNNFHGNFYTLSLCSRIDSIGYRSYEKTWLSSCVYRIGDAAFGIINTDVQAGFFMGVFIGNLEATPTSVPFS